MPPKALVVDIRGQTQGIGPARVGTLDGGKFFTQIGPDIPQGGKDPTRLAQSAPHQLCIRMRGLLYAFVGGFAAGFASVYVFDEGGTNNWTTGVAAKGGLGVPAFTNSADVSALGPFLFVQTATRDFIVVFAISLTNRIVAIAYDPSVGGVGARTATTTISAIGPNSQPHAIVHDGIVHVAGSSTDLNNVQTFDPATLSWVDLGFPALAYPHTHTSHFTLHGRLFLTHMRSDVTNPWITTIFEFSLGAWGVTSGGATTNHGVTAASDGADLCAIPISPTKVLLFGAGGGSGAAGLVCTLLETVGNSPTGNLVTTDVTAVVIPAALRPTSAVGDSGDYRVGCVVDNVSVPGSVSFYLYFMSDGVGTVTGATLFQVIDELTPLVDMGATQSDSDFAHPRTFYGGGHVLDGIDGSTRLVTVSPRGYAKGTTGLIVKCSAHGDAVVLAHGGVTAGPFTDGEILTGGTSGATGKFVGDGAAEGVYLHEASGTFTPGESVTGVTSLASIVLDHVLVHGTVADGPFQVGEVVTGGTSLATGVVTHLGLGGAGEQLVKVDTVVGGPFVNGETITGGTSLATAVLSAAPSGQHGGAADKTIRARFFFKAAGPTGKGTPITGACTMVAGSGTKGTVSKGTGPGGEDELINVVADGTVGTKDSSPPSFEWDFLTDGVPSFLVDSLAFEIDRI